MYAATLTCKLFIVDINKKDKTVYQSKRQQTAGGKAA